MTNRRTFSFNHCFKRFSAAAFQKGTSQTEARFPRNLRLLYFLGVLVVFLTTFRFFGDEIFLNPDTSAQSGQVCIAVFLAFFLMDMLKNRFAQFLAVVACFLFVGFIFSFGVIDDTYISLRYARNFAIGNGLVFNVGERVEGYTCFLWVLLLGVVKKVLPLIDLVVLAKGLGIFFGILTLLAIWRFSLNISAAKTGKPALYTRYNVHLLLLVALNFPFLYWSFSGMETSFYSFFLVSAAFYFSRHLTEAPPRMGTLALSGLLFVLALMIRPETYVLFPLTLVFIVLRNRRRSILPIIVFLSSAILIYAPYFVWRLSYYGHLFPNTYYAKVVAPGSYHVTMLGLRYLRIGMVPYLLFIILILIKMARNKGRLRVEEYYLLSLISVQLIGVLAVGADHFSELRYFVYMLPFLYLLSFDEIGNVIDLMAEYIFSSWKSLGLFKGQLLCLICILCFLQSFYYNNAGPKAISEKGDRSLADNWIVLGQWLDANSNADDLIATPVIGAIGYYCDRTIIDMLGLVDPVIAHTDVIPGQGPRDHERYNSEYVMSRKPAYIYVFSPYRTELQFLKNWHWAPAIRDLKKYFPNRDYKYTVVKVLDKEFTLYKRDGQ